MLMSGPVKHARGYLRWIVLGLGLLATSCGDDKPFECEKPADCVGRPAGNYCKMVSGKGRCVIDCAPATAGTDTCPPTLTCNGHADDGSFYCKPQ
jgi:hypothetical protein